MTLAHWGELQFVEFEVKDATCDNKGLAHLQTIDTSVNINSICAEHSKKSHVDQEDISQLHNCAICLCIDRYDHVQEFSENSQVVSLHKEGPKGGGYEHCSAPRVGGQKRQGGHSGKDELIPPF